MILVVILVAVAVVAVVGWLQLHRHGESATADPRWEASAEVFRDPSSGRVMRVWVDPTDGTRHYVPEHHQP